jgi:DNA polymerase phi
MNEVEEEEEESDDSDDSEDENDDENLAPVDEELRAKVQAALAMDVEVDLEDVDDDAMAAFDTKLAEIFSQRKSMKNVKKRN